MYHHGLAAFDLQHVFDTLLRRQADRGDGAGLLQVEDVWHFADVIGLDHGVFRVEPALRIAEAVGVDEVAWREPADAGADGGDGAGAVGAEDEWKRRTLLLRPPPAPHLRVPTADAGGVHGDQHFGRTGLRHGQLVDLQHFRIAKPIDRRGAHRLGDGLRSCVSFRHALFRHTLSLS